ncbi:heme peroxidase [Delphinella strobiligena]|nr:heme peroxidase [Delphinella strobiligena]
MFLPYLVLVGLSCVGATPYARSVSASPRDGTCPAIWTQISSQLTSEFRGTDGQCTDLARAAIRFAFHDSGVYAPASGGADGSLLLSSTEIYRSENVPLQAYHDWLSGFYNKYLNQTSAADLIQFAASHAIVTCPGGPQVKTVVGRTDTTTAGPENQLPVPFGPGSDHDTIFQLFENKGFSAFDLAALVGAHSTSKAFDEAANGIPSGGSQDSTPGQWDNDYYSQMYNPPQGVYRFESDINLSNKSTVVGQQFSGFVGNQGKWNGAFADAMARMSLLGVSAADASQFIDCTSALP